MVIILNERKKFYTVDHTAPALAEFLGHDQFAVANHLVLNAVRRLLVECNNRQV